MRHKRFSHLVAGVDGVLRSLLMELKSKRQAAAVLGLSTRGVERAVARGHLTVLYRDGKHGKQAWFNTHELERLKQVQERQESVGFTSGIPFHPPGPSPAVGTLVPVVDMKPRHKGQKDDSPPVPIAHRLVLSLDEAVQLAGLPRSFLVENIRSGKLKSLTIGRRHFIKRADLNEFVHQL